MPNSHENLSEDQTPSFLSNGSPQPNLEVRHRGGCLTVWLVVMSLIFGLLAVSMAIIGYQTYTSEFLPSLLITNVENILTCIFIVLGGAGVVGMWFWKKWGYYLQIGGFLVCSFDGLIDLGAAYHASSLALDLGQLASGVLGGILLYVVMRKKLVYFD